MNQVIKIKPTLFSHSYIVGLMLLLTVGFALPSCKDDDPDPEPSYQQVNLVASTSSYGAVRVDTNLVNAWGVAISPAGAFWIASTEKDLSTVYDRSGTTLINPITVDGEPTGVVYNPTLDFVIPLSGGLVSKYIYVGEEGTVQSWNSGLVSVKVADNSADGAVYKGVALGVDGGANFIYIANFSENEIEVLDQNFTYVSTKPFIDPLLPIGFAPFNIKNIGGKLYVTYAKQSEDKYDDVSGAGNGYVSIFNTDGTFVKRFASGGTLNSPWGIAQAPSDFRQGSNAILVGNFGDGRINVFTKDGDYVDQLKDGDLPITIEGLWSLTFPANGVPAGDQNQLFFTAGPDNEDHGLFGYLQLR
ncbi:MAG TPA: TIGR03118 family protein [Saprospiraceae bacterium]|nr:TIGR03118 family protein [Saprospiraceae bacterium]